MQLITGRPIRLAWIGYMAYTEEQVQELHSTFWADDPAKVALPDLTPTDFSDPHHSGHRQPHVTYAHTVDDPETPPLQTVYYLDFRAQYPQPSPLWIQPCLDTLTQVLEGLISNRPRGEGVQLLIKDQLQQNGGHQVNYSDAMAIYELLHQFIKVELQSGDEIQTIITLTHDGHRNQETVNTLHRYDKSTYRQYLEIIHHTYCIAVRHSS